MNIEQLEANQLATLDNLSALSEYLSTSNRHPKACQNYLTSIMDFILFNYGFSEDSPIIRDFTAELLDRYGFRALEVSLLDPTETISFRVFRTMIDDQLTVFLEHYGV